jgi:hypothetical protein
MSVTKTAMQNIQAFLKMCDERSLVHYHESWLLRHLPGPLMGDRTILLDNDARKMKDPGR